MAAVAVGVLLQVLLVLILDWTNAGAPLAHDLPAMRQFTRWAHALGGFLAHHGVTDFLTNAEEARGLDDDHAEWRTFLLRWHQLYGDRRVSAQDLRKSAEPDPGFRDPWEGSFPTFDSGRLPSVRSDSHTNSRSYWVERETQSTPENKPANPQTRRNPC